MELLPRSALGAGRQGTSRRRLAGLQLTDSRLSRNTKSDKQESEGFGASPLHILGQDVPPRNGHERDPRLALCQTPVTAKCRRASDNSFPYTARNTPCNNPQNVGLIMSSKRRDTAKTRHVMTRRNPRKTNPGGEKKRNKRGKRQSPSNIPRTKRMTDHPIDTPKHRVGGQARQGERRATDRKENTSSNEATSGQHTCRPRHRVTQVGTAAPRDGDGVSRGWGASCSPMSRPRVGMVCSQPRSSRLSSKPWSPHSVPKAGTSHMESHAQLRSLSSATFFFPPWWHARRKSQTLGAWGGA